MQPASLSPLQVQHTAQPQKHPPDTPKATRNKTKLRATVRRFLPSKAFFRTRAAIAPIVGIVALAAFIVVIVLFAFEIEKSDEKVEPTQASLQARSQNAPDEYCSPPNTNSNSSSVTRRVFHGHCPANDNTFGSIAYLVSVDVESGNITHTCTGVLVTHAWLLTAEHCITDLPKGPQAYAMYAYLGCIDVFSPSCSRHGILPTVYNTGCYKEKRAPLHPFDIVLLRLDPPAPANIPLLPIHRVSSAAITADTPRFPAAGTAALAMGFGTMAPDGSRRYLLQAFPFISDNIIRCAQSRSPRQLCTFSDTITQGTVCAGDSGGPLMLGDNNVVYGLLSGNTYPGGSTWYDACLAEKKWMAYVDIGAFANWINATIARRTVVHISPCVLT